MVTEHHYKGKVIVCGYSKPTQPRIPIWETRSSTLKKTTTFGRDVAKLFSLRKFKMRIIQATTLHGSEIIEILISLHCSIKTMLHVRTYILIDLARLL